MTPKVGKIQPSFRDGVIKGELAEDKKPNEENRRCVQCHRSHIRVSEAKKREVMEEEGPVNSFKFSMKLSKNVARGIRPHSVTADLDRSCFG